MRDVTHSARRLLHTPGHSVAVILTLALGIGATTMIFSVVHGVLIEPLPFPDQDRIAMLWQRAPGVGVEQDWFSPAQYFDLRQVSSFEEVAIFVGVESTLTGKGAKPRRIGVLRCSSSLFQVLGIKTAAGRPFLAADDVPGAEVKVLLSHHLFTQRFGGDERVIGTTIILDGGPLEVIGVLPEPVLDAGMLSPLRPIPLFDVLLSLPLVDPQVTVHGSENLNVMAKLRPQTTASRLDSELLATAALFAKDPDSLAGGLTPGTEYRIDVVPLHEQVIGNARSPLLVLLGATGLLLVIACVNVANLLLARAAKRSRQLAIRVALGARRRRVFVLSMVENLTLALLGGIVGLGIADAGLDALRLLAPSDLPRMQAVALNPGILLFTGLVCIGSSVLFGVGPALRDAGVAPVEVLSEAGPALPMRSVWRRGVSGYLVIVQVALSLMLLVGAGLLVRTFQQLRAVDPGFSAQGVLSFRVAFSGKKYDDPATRVMFFDRLRAELEGVRGVDGTGGVTLLPMTDMYAWTDFAVEGYTAAGARGRIVADEQFITPGYLDTMGISLLAGRDFTDKDDDEPMVAMVDRLFAERFWSVDDAIGKWVLAYPGEKKATIVGVVDSIRHYGLADEPRMTAFFPYRARPVRMLYGAARVAGDPELLAPVLSDIVARLDADMPVYDVRSMLSLVDDSMARERLLAYVLYLFGAIALILATVGLYGVLSFAVATHAHELAVRMALGARRRDLYRLVLHRARAVTFAGIGLGFVAALAVARMFEGLVFGVSTLDPVSFTSAVVIVAGVALLASYVPARRASRVDPMTALKRY